MKIASIRTARNKGPRHFPKVHVLPDPSITSARQALTQAQECVDQLNGRELDTVSRQRLDQVQIFIHEALLVIADD